MMERCKKCGGLHRGECALIARWWIPGDGETRRDAKEIWGQVGYEIDRLMDTIEQADGDSAGELIPNGGEATLVRLQPCDGETLGRTITIAITADFSKNFYNDTPRSSEIEQEARRVRSFVRSRGTTAKLLTAVGMEPKEANGE